MPELELNRSDEKKEGFGNTRVVTDADSLNNVIRAVTNCSMYGNGYAYAQLFDYFFTGSDGGIYEFTVDYFREANVRNAEGQVNVIVKDYDTGAITRKTVENIDTSRNSSTTRSTEVTLYDNESYYVGVEIYTQAQAGGDPAAYADVYNQDPLIDRRVDVNSFSYEYRG